MNTAVHHRFSAAHRFSYFSWGYFCYAESNKDDPMSPLG